MCDDTYLGSLRVSPSYLSYLALVLSSFVLFGFISFLFVVFALFSFFMVSLELCRCPCDLFLSSRRYIYRIGNRIIYSCEWLRPDRLMCEEHSHVNTIR